MTTLKSRPQSTILSRADLLWAMVERNPDAVQVIAAQLGMFKRKKRPKIDYAMEMERLTTEARILNTASDAVSSGDPNQTADASIWLMTHYASRRDPTTGLIDQQQADEAKPSYWRWTSPPTAIPCQKPLAPWPVIWQRLRQSWTQEHRGQRIDFPKLVDRFAKQELIRRIPRLADKSGNGRLTIVRDSNPHLAPYFADQKFVIDHLKPLHLPQSFAVLTGQHPQYLHREISADGQIDFVPDQPIPGSRILVLGDLGVLSPYSEDWRVWLHWGRLQQMAGCQLTALFPGGTHRVPNPLRDVFDVQTWQVDRSSSVADDHIRQQLIKKLLILAAPALRLEPGLLRDLRLLLPNASDASLEADLWNSPMLSSCHFLGATIDRQLVRDELRPAFEALSESLRNNVLECLRRWRKLLEDSPEVYFEEILNLSANSRKLIKQSSDIQDARANWQKFDQLLSPEAISEDGIEEFVYRFTRRATDDVIEDEEIGSIVRKYRMRFHEELGVHPSTDPIEVDSEEDLRSFKIEVTDTKVITSITDDDSEQNPFAQRMRGTNNYLRISQPVEREFWKTGKPDFVSDYGTDRYGAWFEFSVPRRDGQGVVTQRMRWIRAGAFLMGSPETELNRSSNETQHEVTLSRGYWLADTTCTQELWRAIKNDNPSRFTGDLRPVEQVSYDDIASFFKTLSELIPILNPTLPTEAQWEYACRAGTQTPFSFGETITTYQVNFDGNYPYGDSPKGTYRKETVEVKSLPANPWGLYEMHGNVWEWCRDWHAEYSRNRQVDPMGPQTGSFRVLRGGGWGSIARHVRSACRYWDRPGLRYQYLGFRLLSSATAEPTEAAEVPVAEQGPQQTRFGGADEIFLGKTVRVDEGGTTQVELNRPDRIRIRSNLEEVYFQRMAKPEWAREFERDRFGVYADFEVVSLVDSQPVRQRMRWIPPGQFQMGSPDSEPERFENEILHPVTISSSFWMFDTPCTQRLWQAIMPGKDPSRFPDPDRPVESVSWEDASTFAKNLGKTVGLDFGLPTEAQWEYACRAGTSTAIYTGPLEILGDGNAPALDPIAWYGGNCGHDYDLVKGDPVTWLKNKQYEFEKGGTRQVKKKQPNPWGLYDMLGNVWEWCEDRHGEYLPQPQVDPKGPEEGSGRVVRGGSWSDSARSVRSACRYWGHPGHRYQSLGFRLLSSASQVLSGPVRS